MAPPLAPPKVLSCSKLADIDGMLDIDSQTLIHKRFPTVFGIGDCIGCGVGRSFGAVGAQAKVLTKNIISAMLGEQPKALVRFDCCSLEIVFINMLKCIFYALVFRLHLM